MNPWATIDPPTLQENLLNVGGQPGIFSAMLGSLSGFPRILAALRDVKCLAKQCDRGGVSVLCNELKPQSWGAKRCLVLF